MIQTVLFYYFLLLLGPVSLDCFHCYMPSLICTVSSYKSFVFDFYFFLYCL